MQRIRSSLLLAIAAALVAGSILIFSTRGQAAPVNYDSMPPLVAVDLPPEPTIAPVPASAQQPNTAPVLLESTFENASAQAQWTALDLDTIPLGGESPRWKVREGRIYQYGSGELATPAFIKTAAVSGDEAWTDYTLTAKAYPIQNDEIGLLFRVKGNTYYRFRMLRELYSDPRMVLEKVIDGTVTQLATANHAGFRDHTWYVLKAQVVGSSITVEVNGKAVLSATDTSIPAGKIGVYGIATGDLFYDDVTVTAVQK